MFGVDVFKAKYFQSISFSKHLKFCIFLAKEEEIFFFFNEILIPSLHTILSFLFHRYGLSFNSEHAAGTKFRHWKSSASFRKTADMLNSFLRMCSARENSEEARKS